MQRPKMVGFQNAHIIQYLNLDFHEDVLVWWEVSEYHHYQHYKAGVLAL